MSKRSFITTGKKVLASAVSAAMVVAFTPVVALGANLDEGALVPVLGESETMPAVHEKTVALIDKDKNGVVSPGDAQYSTLQKAIEQADPGATVLLIKDVNLENAINLTKSITIDGSKEGMTGRNGEGCHTVKTTDTDSGRAFNVGGGNNPYSDLDITFKNISVAGPMSKANSRGISAYRAPNAKVTLNNVYVFAAAYAFNIASGCDGLSATITNSKLEGWCSFQLWSPASVTVSNSILLGTNKYIGDNYTNFATIVVNQCSVASSILVEESSVLAVSDASKNTPQVMLKIQNINNDGSQAYPQGNSVVFRSCKFEAEGKYGQAQEYSLEPLYLAVGSNSITIDSNNLYVPEYGNYIIDYMLPEASVARAGQTIQYGSLDTALSDAKSGETITLLDDIEAYEQINIPEGVTLDGSGHTISAVNPESWSTNSSEKYLVLLTGAGSGLANVTLDCNKVQNAEDKWVGPYGVQTYAATNAKIENVTVQESASCGLNINASQATIGKKLSLKDNAWGDYVNLSWGTNVSNAPETCALVIASGTTCDFSHVWTDKGDMTNAGISSASDWNKKFSITDNSAYYYWSTSIQDDGVVATRYYYDPTPVTPPADPEVGDKGTVELPTTPGESGSAGSTKVDVTVTDTTATTDSKGNKVDGSVSIDKIETTGTAVSIPETITTDKGTFLVTSIPASAMEGNSTATTVAIPESVTTIGEGAFSNCTALTTVTVPAGVTEIAFGTFAGCTNLETVEIQGEVTQIASNAFSGCESLSSVTIPETVTTIGSGAFSGCSNLTSTSIPAGVSTIEPNTFAGCTSLTSVEVKGELTEIAADAFNGCESLTSMTVAGTVRPLATRAASSALVIPASVTKIGDRAFKGTGITSVTVPAGVKMGTGVFRDCKQLTKAAVASKVKAISAYTFKGCSALKSVTIPGTVTKIERSAFSGCKSLAKVTIPKGVASIGKNALYGASKVKTLTVNSKKLTKSSVKGALAGSKVTTVKVPKSMLKSYAKVFAKSVVGKAVKVRAI